MAEFELYVGGEPVAQGRPRFSTINGHAQAIDPSKSREFKRVLSAIAREKMAQRPPMQGPLCLYLQVTRVPPKGWAKYRRRDAIEFREGICSKPDLDNYIKIVLDALNGVVFPDDSSVVKICSSKRWSDRPGMTIRIMEDKP